jgi:hypothetical protein
MCGRKLAIKQQFAKDKSEWHRLWLLALGESNSNRKAQDHG